MKKINITKKILSKFIITFLIMAVAMISLDFLFHKYAPINFFITISEYKLLDSKDMQLGYTIRRNKEVFTGDYNLKYFCKNDDGEYMSRDNWNVTYEGIVLHSTNGMCETVNMEFPYPEGVSGECMAYTDITLHIIGNIHRYYGQFINEFYIDN